MPLQVVHKTLKRVQCRPQLLENMAECDEGLNIENHIRKEKRDMGHRKKGSLGRSLHQQAYDRLTGMQAFGESKKEAKREGTDRDKIFSFNTYQTYWKHTKYFLHWVQKQYPECTTLKKAKLYVNEWLQERCDQGLSAWTIQTEEAALNKLYQISPDDPERFQAPKRNRRNIKRSRSDAKRDKHFSETNNDELIKFCKGTGLRKSELASLKGQDLVTKSQIEKRISKLEKKSGELTLYELRQLEMLHDTRMFQGKYFIYVRNGKGGRKRLSPIIGQYSENIVERMLHTGKEENVWQYVNANADIHGYRSDYATAIYKAYARNLEDIPFDRVNKGTGRKYQSDVYTCRKDESGKKLDRVAMLACSKALGHNRLCIVADNYLRGI